jgi:hypothetical protein
MAKRPKYGGRRAGTPNKATGEIKALARSYAPAAMKELARLSVKAESEQARVAAIKELFDRGFGKATQAVQHSGSVGTYDLTKVTDDDLDRLENILRAASVTGVSAEREGATGAGSSEG